jgi:glycosyltransferase involved in cell wall biosynthesis
VREGANGHHTTTTGPTPLRRVALVMRNYADTPRLERMAHALAERGTDVLLVCLRRDGDEPDVEHGEGITIVRLGRGKRRGSRLRYAAEYGGFAASALAVVQREAARRRFDLVQVVSPPDALLASALPARLGGAALVLDVYDLSPELYASKFAGGGPDWPFGSRVLSGIERAATTASRHVLCAGEEFRSALMRRGVPPWRITSIPNSPDERELDASLRNDVDRFQLAYCGSLFDRYGLATAVKAMPAVAAAVPDVRLDVWGEGPDLESLRSLSARLGVADRVHFRGMAPHKDVPRLIANAACGVSTLRSDIFTELAFPAKLWEYATLGVPIAASRTAPVTRVFGEDAISFFPPGDSTTFGDRVIRLLRDPAAAERQAAAARKATEPWLWSRWKGRYVALVEHLARSA